MDRKELFENYLLGAAGYLEKEDFRNARACLSLAKELLEKEMPKAKDRKSLADGWNRLGLAFLRLYQKARALKKHTVAQEGFEGHSNALAISRLLAEGKKGEDITEVCIRIYKTEWSEEEIKELEQKVEKDSKNAELLRQLGHAYCLSGEKDKALNTLEAALEIKKGDPGILEELGHVHFNEGDIEKAFEIYDRILSEHPGRTLSFYGKNTRLRYRRG